MSHEPIRSFEAAANPAALDNSLADIVARAKADPGAPFEAPDFDVLAKLCSDQPADWQRLRAKLKTETDIRIGDLDRALSRKMGGEVIDDKPALFADLEPWPDEVDGDELATEIAATFAGHVKMPPGASTAAAVWVLHAHAHESAAVSPILAITSPSPECGKTTFLTVLSGLVPRALAGSSITTSVLFRAIEKWHPTMLLDEGETYIGDSEELRGCLNSGHSRATAFILRNVQVGDDYEPRQFRTWAPKAIALIGRLPATLASRSIHIELQRRGREDRVTEIRGDRLHFLEPLRRKAARWAIDNTEISEDPDMGSLFGRRADNWRHLYSIADTIGGDWPRLAREAARLLTGRDADSQTEGIMLLEDLRRLFSERDTDRLLTTEILEALAQREDRPWIEWKAGKPITARQMAKLLEPFKICSNTIRADAGRGKGYELEHCRSIFTQYIPDLSVTTGQPAETKAFSPNPIRDKAENVTDKKPPKPMETAACHGVTAGKGETGEKGTWEAET